MRNFFEGIAHLFESVLFVPLEILRFIEESNWTLSNTINWIFLVVGLVASVYWIIKLRKFDRKGEENKEITAHTYL